MSLQSYVLTTFIIFIYVSKHTKHIQSFMIKVVQISVTMSGNKYML